MATKETFEEQVGRLKSMSEPAGTWDLSQNDMAAIRAVLANHGELLKALKELVEISGEANIPLTSTKSVRLMAKFIQAREAAQAVIAKAEATNGN